MTSRFKLGDKTAREAIAALMPIAPWYARPQLEALLDAPLGVEIRVEKIKRTRSTSQNNFYWLGVGIFAKAVGMTPDEAHEAVLCEYHGSTEVRIGERVHHVPKGRSHNLDTVAMGELIETLFRVSAFCGVTLPDPQAVA
jgi:DNA-binding transcriptional regulator PaaX